MIGSGRRQPSLITFANEQVPIATVCRLIGVDLPGDGVVYRLKLHCPFGDIYHTDGGMQAAMRIYPDSNNLFCFAGCGFFSPVTLAAQAWDLTRRAAARELLERLGIVRAASVSVWAELDRVDPPDRTLLAQALRTFCRRAIPGWEQHQFDAGPAQLLNRCLALLDHVRTDEDAQRWLEVCKAAMSGPVG
jgi:hypothetical protein